MAPSILYTIPFSHYCEKARWALAYAGVAFEERGHLPGVTRAITARYGGTTVPLLVTARAVLKDSRSIVAHADREALSAERRLLPDTPEALREALALEARFDRRMGVASRAWAYSYLLSDLSRLLPVASQHISSLERRALPWLGGAMTSMIRRGLRIGPTTREWARTRIREDLDFVGSMLEDGRAFLVGDRFSTADLTFASLAAPALFPEEYGGPLPSLDAIEPAMADEVRAFRDTPAGQFALRIYRERRSSFVGA